MGRLDYPTAVLLGLLVATALGLVVAGATADAAFGLYNPTWEGTSELRSRADGGLTRVQDVGEYADLEADGTVAFVLSPSEPYGETRPIETFLRRGGTLVVAEDFGRHSNGLLESIGASARLDGRLLRDEDSNYRSSALPVATNVSNASLVEGLDGITLNHGTAIDPGGARVLIGTSSLAYLDGNRNATLDADERLGSYPVVVRERLGAGSVVVVGDPSIFVNAMLDRPGNAAFLDRLVARQEGVVVDLSHADRLPPLRAAVFALRRSPPAQVLLGGLAIGLVALAAGSRESSGRLPGFERLPGLGRASARTAVDPDPDRLATYLRERHPDWEDERIERVVSRVGPEADSEGESNS